MSLCGTFHIRPRDLKHCREPGQGAYDRDAMYTVALQLFFPTSLEADSSTEVAFGSVEAPDPCSHETRNLKQYINCTYI